MTASIASMLRRSSHLNKTKNMKHKLGTEIQKLSCLYRKSKRIWVDNYDEIQQVGAIKQEIFQYKSKIYNFKGEFLTQRKKIHRYLGINSKEKHNFLIEALVQLCRK
jgi:hypothetical protein